MKLKKQVINKLDSGKGASILFALFVFLVCATVGSIVLASGTAAAGRISKVSENDSRYYSVMSAVNLIRDEVENQKFEIYRQKTTTITNSYTITNEGSEDVTNAQRVLDGEPSEEVSYITKISQLDGSSSDSGGAAVTKDSSLMAKSAISLVLGDASKAADIWAASYPAMRESESITGDFTLKLKNDGTGENAGEYESLQADVNYIMDSNGEMLFTISSPSAVAGGAAVPKYSVRLVLQADVQEESEITQTSPEEFGAAEDVAGVENQFSQTSTQTETSEKTATVTIKFVRLETKF